MKTQTMGFAKRHGNWLGWISALRRGGFGASPTVPLAWRNLSADKTRLLRSISGISFAALLMMIQLGFRDAFLDSALAIIRNVDGDIFLTSPTKFRFGRQDGFSYRLLYAARAVPGVAWARPIHGEWLTSSWKNPQTHKLYNVQVLAFDPMQPVFLFPEIAASIDELKQPDTVLMDRRARRFVGNADNGTVTELARRQIRVIGEFSLGPDFTTDGTVIMSDWNFRRFFPPKHGLPASRNDVEFGAVKIAPGNLVDAVAADLRAALGPELAVRTRAEFIGLEVAFQNSVSPVGPIFLLGTMIGFIVGLMISYQILYTELSDQESQYATLNAMGYRSSYLVRVVLTQSAFYAIAGFLPAAAAALPIFYFIGESALLPLHLNLRISSLAFALTLGMCLVAGALAVRRVIEADPAEIF
jgi:putative ABC transport system permease protein